MPRQMSAELRACYERANPRVRRHVELFVPDVSVVLRRASDQFFTTPPLVAGTLLPVGSLAASPAGGMHLTPTIVNVATVNESQIGTPWRDIRPFPLERFRKGLGWEPDAAFVRGTLRNFSARVRRLPTHVFGLGFYYQTRYELQIYRAIGTPGVLRYEIPPGSPAGTQPREVKFTEWTFEEKLSPACVVPHVDVIYDGNNVAWVNFPLENWGLLLENVPPPGSADVAYTVNRYYFVVTALDVSPTADEKVVWLLNNAPQAIAGIGSFRRREWTRPNTEPQTEWKEDPYADCQAFKLDIDGYTPAGGQAEAIYSIDLGRVPEAAAAGRIAFEANRPSGTSATLELSTAGSGGPWALVKHADPIAIKQQTYHLRVRLQPDAANRSTPVVNAFGVEFKIPYDVSHLAVTKLVASEVSVPLLKAAIGEGELRIIKPGIQDYQDVATEIASTKAPPTLEADVYLATDHPAVGREFWFLLNRATISNRQPLALEERFTLLSYLRRLKTKIPKRKETINSVHRVQAGSTVNQLIVTPPLIGTTTLGNEYDGAGYYMRIRKTASLLATVGYLQRIDGNTGTDRLDFSAGGLPDVLAANDEIEVHSARYTQPVLSWVDADPADVWWEILTSYVGIPPERIGMAGLGRGKRSGLPLTVLERAPGDTTTQARLKVTRQITDATEADKLIDELSFIMQGVTGEIAGQIVFRQVYPMRGPNGNIIIPVDPVARVFLPTDYINLGTPTGLEERASVYSADYGVNSAQSVADVPPNSVTFVDADAVAHHTQQDLEQVGSGTLPDDISAWLYNSNDSGQYLAALLAQQVALATSTGLRLWPWTGVGAGDDPSLVFGDTVEVVTNQYTDYDPATKQQIRGWFAYRMVVVAAVPGALGAGTHFRGFMLGLPPSAQKLAGGPGTLSGAGAPIDFPADLSLTTQVVQTETGGALRLIASYTPLTTPFLSHVEYAVRTRRNVADGWSASDTIPGTGRGADFIKADYNAYHEVTARAVSSGGNRAGVAQVRELFTGPPPAAGPSIGSVIQESTRIRWPITYDQNTKRVEVWYSVYPTDPGALVSQWKTGTKLSFEHHRDDQRGEIVIPIPGQSWWAMASFVYFNAWDDLNASSVVTVKAQGAAPLVPLAIIAAPTQVTGYPTSTEQQIDVTIPWAI